MVDGLAIQSHHSAQANSGMRNFEEAFTLVASSVAEDKCLSAMIAVRKAAAIRLFTAQLDLTRAWTGDADQEDRDNILRQLAKMLRNECLHIVAIGVAAGQAAHMRIRFMIAYEQHARDSALAEPERALPLGEFASLLKSNTTAKTEAEKAIKALPKEEPKEGPKDGPKRDRPWPAGGGWNHQQGRGQGGGPFGPMKREQ